MWTEIKKSIYLLINSNVKCCFLCFVAVDLDGCNVVGYTAWCLMDNYEWEFGYLEHFGIHYTNFSSPDRERIAKDSAKYFKQVVLDNGFPAPVTDPPPTIPDNSASGLYISWLMMILCMAFV